MPYVYPSNALDYCENFLTMLFKTPAEDYTPNPALVKALEVLFILHADHEQNCGTNAMRSIGSAHTDPYSSLAGAAAALYGPLHGGANEEVLKMLEEIGTIAKVPAFIEEVKQGKGEKRLMGFGHRVYKNFDPRAKIIKRMAEEVFEVTGRNPLLDIALELERIALQDELLRQAQALPERRLLLRPDLRGDRHPVGGVHRPLRDPAHVRAGSRSGRRCSRIRGEDRASAAGLPRPRRARVRADGKGSASSR
jgi:citrate synthase